VNTAQTVVIGAGHAGLAVSRLLTMEGRDHVVLDRGRVAESWRSARWDSLHLLTPNWMTRLPGWCYTGPDSDGYLPAGGLVRLLERYAASFGAPVVSGTRVEVVRSAGSGYEVVTDRGSWRSRHVVIATGPGDRPHVPPAVHRLDPQVLVLGAAAYRNPAQLPQGAVLVVGASASGVQIAHELATAGRDVVLSVGRHTRMPRRYRGMDIFWWLERTGRTRRTIDEMPDAREARREPSMQLIGRGGPRRGDDLDLAVLQRQGVRLTGRLVDGDRHRVWFADDLADSAAAADRRMNRFLDVVDRHIDDSRLTAEVWEGHRPVPLSVAVTPTSVDLRAEGIGTVVLATGYRPHRPWLRLPITAADGFIEQYRGATTAPGVFVVGQRFQHRRDSGMIDGARHDAQQVVAQLTGLAGRRALSRSSDPSDSSDSPEELSA
jgi:putative flavoprotein involved in K+ transport